ncbi:MAG: hypothetical protein R6V53_04350 [Candidatus Woesearchaeota archaeon]
MLKLLGIFDLFIGVVVLFWVLFPGQFLMYIAFYLLFKGFTFAFFGDMLSWLDVVIGLYMILLTFEISFGLVTILSVIYLLQKGLFSLI